MNRLAALFNSDVIPVAILTIILIEGVVLFAWQRRGPLSIRRSLTSPLLVSFLGAGAALVVAMMLYRGPNASPLGFAFAMLCALVFHLWHLTVLLRR